MRQLCKYATILQALLGSLSRLTMEIELEGVFYVVCPDAISRQLPVTSTSSERDTVELQCSSRSRLIVNSAPRRKNYQRRICNCGIRRHAFVCYQKRKSV
jgi:hypothetical protein